MSPSDHNKSKPPNEKANLTVNEKQAFSATEELEGIDDRKQKPQTLRRSFAKSSFLQNALALVEHTGSTAIAAICFWFTGLIIKALVHGWIRVTVDTIEGIGLIVLVIWFFIQTFRQLYNANKGNHNGSHSILVV